MKRVGKIICGIFCIGIIALIINMFFSTASLEANSPTISTDKLEYGLIEIIYEEENDIEKFITIEISGGRSTAFFTKKNRIIIPGIYGNETYTISVYHPNSDNENFKNVQSRTFTMEVKDDSLLFVYPNIFVDWVEGGSVHQKAMELTENLYTDMEKVEAIFNYITMNISYDYETLDIYTEQWDAFNNKREESGGIQVIDLIEFPALVRPSITEDTLESKSGLCEDYASLFGAMLRSIDIPAKLVAGSHQELNLGHAWNEVFIDNEWFLIDTTYSAADSTYPMLADREKYIEAGFIK